MKALITSDWHVDKETAGLPRFDDITAAVREMVNVAVKETCAYFVFLGDYSDPDTGAQSHRYTEFLLTTALDLRARGVRSIWLNGNHDVVNSQEDRGTLRPLVALSRLEWHPAPLSVRSPTQDFLRDVEVCTRPQRMHLWPGVDFLALPYPSLSNVYDADAIVRSVIGTFKPKHRATDTLIVGSHLQLEGILPGSETSDMSRGRDVGFPFSAIDALKPYYKRTVVVQGHYHKPQVFRGIHVVGSPVNLTFGETSHKPSFLLLEV